jgi:hypothetical protein
MGKEKGQNTIEAAAAKFEMVEGLERALDLSYRRLVRAARAEWERRFSRKDPSDACVTVRISASDAQLSAVRGSGFLKAGKPAQTKAKLPLPRLAR